MTTTDNRLALAMDTGWLGRQVKVSPLCTSDDVTAGGRLVPIGEVKTPTSPLELPPGVGDDDSGGEGFQGDGPTKVRGGAASLPVPTAPPDELSPAHSPAHPSGGTSPSMASVVCRGFG